jgi:hypothetical protein
MDVAAIAPRVSRGALGLALLLLVACAGNGEGLDANGRPLIPGGGGSPPPLSDDFESLQANIFTPICSVCHVGDSAPEGLRLDAANSFNFLVGVPSTEVPSLMRVKPGDPDNSYIIQKLEGHAAVGVQMPKGEAPLSTATIAFVREWITNGAQPAQSNAITLPLAVTAILPEADAKLSASPAQIMIAFNHDLDVTQIDPSSIRIESLSGAATPSNVVTARVTVSSSNLHALMIWPSRSLAAGRYRVVSSGARISDVAGQSVALGLPDELGNSVITTFEVGAAR